MADKMSKKELKEPDAFQKVGAEARDWMAERQRVIATIAGGVLAVGLLVSIGISFSGRSDQRSAAALGAALAPLTRPVSDNATESAPSDEPPFKSRTEKDVAIRTSLTEFQAKHPEGKTAEVAHLALGHTELRMANADAAMPHFEEYLKRVPSSDILRLSALEGKGYAFEQKGQLEEALTAFGQLAQDAKSDFLVGMGKFHRARILVQQNKKEEAAKIFQEVQTEHPKTAAARLSGDRLTVLAGEGIVPPAAAAVAKPDGG